MKQLVDRQRTYFYTGETRPYAHRVKQLKKLKRMLKQYEENIYDVLKKDLNKGKHEVITTELGILHAEIDFTLKHLKDWMEDEPVPAPITHKGTKSYVAYEPYGVTVIISPWNYPIQLAIAPAIGAIAAGNTIILKPSEVTQHSSQLLHEMITDTFDQQYFTVVEGAKETTEQLLAQQVDYIFFTGSTPVGKKIMEQASKHVTPVTLELGGKSPAIIDQDCKINVTAKRIAWGKYTNAGQTCVAPDYVYVHRSIYKKFLKALKRQIRRMYSKDPLTNEQYVKIVSKRHFERLQQFLQEGTIIHGGKVDEERLIIEPTIVEDIHWDHAIMQEEIFGPILPILPYEEISDVISLIQRKDKPLALYYFGNSKTNEQKILSQIPFGGGCVNDTLYHLANPHLPFGGVGHSGMGAYHGKYSFETFSHKKSILKQTTLFDLPFRYPGGKLTKSIIKRLMT